MGTILSALSTGKPLIVFPRIAALGEHRNEHQLATAEKMKTLGYCYVAKDKDELKSLLLSNNLHPLCSIGDYASASLVQSITEFIKG